MSVSRLTFYADDFTGATDALESLTRGGLRTALFLEPPTAGALEALGDLDAVGLAGDARSLSPEAMRTTLPGALTALAALGAPLCHYKVCSTFDSSPTVGSIGAAVEIGRDVLGGAWTPVLVGVPALGRWCVFGTLFARSGADGPVLRLDRHPVSGHPVTPMREAEPLRHLAGQTSLPQGLVVTHLAGGEPPERQLECARTDGASVVLFDVADEQDLLAAGKIVSRGALDGEAPLVVGSSGVGYALTAYWQREEGLHPAVIPPLEPARRTLVLSGSCSPITAEQIEAARRQGWRDVPLDTPALLGVGGDDAALDLTASAVVDALERDDRVLVHTACGPRDPRVIAMRAQADAGHHAQVLGSALARVAEAGAQLGDVRMLFTGGDTSSAAARALGVKAGRTS